MMEKALKRIKLLKIAISFLLNLYNERKIKVITEYGLTEEFVAGDSLDQGEVVSPLIWRIFYDPLLCIIYKEEDIGYKIELNWLQDLKTNKLRTTYWQQGVLAYADDTIWIARSQKKIQKLINISSEFYELNDIEINSKKSELLVLNLGYNQTTDSILRIKIGESNEIVHAKRGKNAIRYLGV